MGRSSLEEEANKAIEFSQRLIETSIRVAGSARFDIEPGWAQKPEVIALVLLCRTTSNFNAALTLLHGDIIMEARAIIRGMFENQLWIAALREKGSVFVEAMKNDEAANRTAIGGMTVKLSCRHGGDINSPETLRLRELIRKTAKEFQAAKKVSATEVAAQGVCELAYIPYLQLSHDALHCSFTALQRHLSFEREGDIMHHVMSVHPNSKPEEKTDTILMACNALLGVAIAANEIMGFIGPNARNPGSGG